MAQPKSYVGANSFRPNRKSDRGPRATVLGGAQGACAYQRAEGVSGGEAGVLSKCERKRRTRQRPSLFVTCLRRPHFFQQRKKWGKERRQKPMVFGFPLSDCDCGIKRFRIESLVRLSPLPLPCSARRCAGLSALRRRVGMPFYKIRFAAARIFYISRPNRPHLHMPLLTASARFDNRPQR
mgnify:CR=1 FL=1